jgi:hypothetical protein
MRRYLVVANQTLGGQPLLTRLKAIAELDDVSLFVVVPATPPAHPGPWTHGEAHRIAEERLATAMETFRALGAKEVDGCVGSQRPMDAIRDALRGRNIDEIIISTLPAGMSKWLHQDLPHRVARWFEVPVSHVIGDKERLAV